MTTKNVMAAVIIVMAVAGSVNANDSTYRKSLKIIPRTNNDIYKLIYEREQAEPVYVSIKDLDGNLLAAERFSRTTGFILPLNMRAAKSGTYNVEVKTKTDVIEETIEHTSTADYLKDHLFLQKNGTLVGLVGYDLGNTQLQLNIYDDAYQSIFNESISADDILQKEYNLGGLKSEVAYIMVYHDGQVVLESEIEIK